jgi:hypothetical protein
MENLMHIQTTSESGAAYNEPEQQLADLLPGKKQ